LVAPTFSATASVEKLTTAENLLGGIDVAAIVGSRPDLFGPALKTEPTVWTPTELATAKNNAYRSLIVPPPAVAATSEYPNGNINTEDDSGIAASRAYNKSGLVIQIASNNKVTITKIENGTTTDVTADYSGITSTTSNFYDEREKKVIKVNTIDIEKLGDKLTEDYPTFNGMLYVNLQNSSSITPAAIKIINGSDLPILNTGPTSDTIKGFSISTNGGIYLQGSFNNGTTITNSDGTTRAIPAMLMGDSITIISANYKDSAVSRPLTARVAKLTDEEISAGGMTINAGLLTGNVASSGSIGKSSGGAQNLIRYLEDWTGININFDGSIGCLFQSTQYTASFPGPGTVYNPPLNRVFSFDENLQSYPPPGNPTTTEFSRGTFITWDI
jgi:hypothetical protein